MEQVSGQVSFPKLETEVLQFWERDNTFARSKQKRKNNKAYLFYDGPPFANGLPHYGHILANTIKDVVPRYWTMRGFYVDRRFGWDCHGLPVEYEIEKREGYKGRQDILRIGVEKFNHLCRESVMHYAQEWQRTIKRLGRWVDWQNQYRTMDLAFMESVWWVCKQLKDKGLLYQGHKVVPYSPRITAVLSNFEANQNYKEIQDPALTVKVKCTDEEAFFLFWTTTPWTLISNLALAVHRDISYVQVETTTTKEKYYLAESALSRIFPQASDFRLLKNLSGKELVGRNYQYLYPFSSSTAGAFQILSGDFVSSAEGTGIVHMSPAFGEDDYKLCMQHNIKPFDPLDNEGKFTQQAGEYAGLYFKDADKKIIRDLKTRQLVLRHDTLVHRYPFCERTDTPLIYRAIPAWYVAVEKFKDRLCKHNESINWVPRHLQHGRVGNWLQNAQDWAISRNRFWGTPLPIWLCADKCKRGMTVVGSLAQLQELTGEKVNDLHKHVVDKLQIPCPDCSKPMSRVPEVLDCWFESGSMPCAQNHYPFSQRQQPPVADFIAEGLDQTRGWFYTLNVLSTALFDQPAFKNVVVNGTILDEHGKKMSKRHRNYTAPDALMEKYGSDSVRLYLLNSPLLRAEDLHFSDSGVVDTLRSILLPLWNAFSFLSTYSQANGWVATKTHAIGESVETTSELDAWIISKLQSLYKSVHMHMESYRINLVLPCLVAYIDTLTNWYIRLNRRRFWGEETKFDSSAFATLYHVLLNFCKVLAPFAPFISERIYRTMTSNLNLTDDSVHICDMPMFSERLHQPELEKQLELVRSAIELGRKLRAQSKIKTRQVLPKMLIITNNAEDARTIEKFTEYIINELNVREIAFSTDESSYVDTSLKPDLKKLGALLGKDLRQVREKLSEVNTSTGSAKAFWHEINTGNYAVAGKQLHTDDFFVIRNPKHGHTALNAGDTTVLLETHLSPELLQEGLAREVINRLQKSRKDCGLQVSDRISVAFQTNKEIKAAVLTHRSYVCRETLSTDINFVSTSPSSFRFKATYRVDNDDLTIFIM